MQNDQNDMQILLQHRQNSLVKKEIVSKAPNFDNILIPYRTISFANEINCLSLISQILKVDPLAISVPLGVLVS
jgi:hypothetical protein